MLRYASNAVFLCCKRLDRYADTLTGKSGPFFILIAITLLFVNIFTYFDVVFRHAFSESGWIVYTTGLLVSLYLIYSFSFYYYKAIRTKPGSPNQRWPAAPSGALHKFLKSNQASRRGWQLHVNRPTTENRTCKKCCPLHGRPPYKPERCHHCRVCMTCVLYYDHHCVWLHNCVGLHNARYFLLFMISLCMACFIVVILGREIVWWSLDRRKSWETYHTPRVLTLLLMILAAVLGCALLIMSLWQLNLIVKGETTVEAQDNDYYRRLLKKKGRDFVNPYDMGWKQNLQFFFNIEPVGDYKWWSVLVPTSISPASDGFVWPKQRGHESNALTWQEELTDDEN